MQYRNYLFPTKEKPSYSKIVFRVIKIFLYVFLFVSMLWGCALMFSNKYNSYQVSDISGQNVYRPGVFFEIIINIGNFVFGKNHYFHMGKDGYLHEYSYLAISSWQEAFTKTQSPFYGCFVYPIADLLITIMNGFGGINNGASILGAIFITSLIIRLITLTFSFKMQTNQEKMQALQLKQSEITAKYKGSRDPASKQKQQLEILNLYRKEGMSPLSSILVIFLSFPFLIAMYTVIKSVRQLKVAHIGNIFLINRPWDMITHGHPVYLALLFCYLPLQLLSMFLPTLLAMRKNKIKTEEQKKARRKQLIIQGVIGIVFFFVTLSIAAGVAIYWIFSAFIQIMQTLFFHWFNSYKKTEQGRKVIKYLSYKQWYQGITHALTAISLIFNPNRKKAILAKKEIIKKHATFDYAPHKKQSRSQRFKQKNPKPKTVKPQNKTTKIYLHLEKKKRKKKQ